MGNTDLQEKIEHLQQMANELISTSCNAGNIYSDNLSLLNRRIHQQIDELYPLRGKSDEQEASRCLAMLMGYSVSMYANPDDERKKQTILKHSQQLIESLLPSLLRDRLIAFYRLLTTDDIHTPTIPADYELADK